jgi:FlaA1/EpsC-like NDP-sugar epimerase
VPSAEPAQYELRFILPERLQDDLWYVRTRTLTRDLGYLIQTPLRLAEVLLSRERFGRLLKSARLFADLSVVILATWLAFIARFDGAIPASQLNTLMSGLPFVMAAYALSFIILGIYRGIWRYAGVEDFWQLVKACLLGGVASAAVLQVLALPFPRTVLALGPMLTILMMGGTRLGWRTAGTILAKRWWTAKRRVVIIGAGRTGEAIAREIQNSPRLGYAVVGFVDDDPRLRAAKLRNLPVLGALEQLDELVRRHQLDEAIIAIPRLPFSELRRIGEACQRAGIDFKTVPSMSQLVQGEGRLRYLRKVNLDELIRREALSVTPERIAAFLRDKRVLVTGAGGTIGSELCRQVTSLGAGALLMVDRAENGLFEIYTELQGSRPKATLTPALADVKHVSRMSELFVAFKPNLVFHAAAYKHVPILENHPTEAVLNNVVGTVRLARLARAHAVENFVFISTDKAVKPGNLMGATKRVCELYLTALNRRGATQNGIERGPQFRVVRFGNVLGSAGSALPLFQRQIESGSPITITDPEVSRFFMTIREAVALVLESAALQAEGDITVLDMGEPMQITKLADDLVTAMGLTPSAIPRRFIGLRPGEKLHEALWEDGDELVSSPHPRIVTLRQPGRPLEEMEVFVRDLERLALAGSVERLLARVQEIIPTYQPVADGGHVEGPQEARTESVAPLEPAEGAPARLRPAVNEAP